MWSPEFVGIWYLDNGHFEHTKTEHVYRNAILLFHPGHRWKKNERIDILVSNSSCHSALNSYPQTLGDTRAYLYSPVWG